MTSLADDVKSVVNYHVTAISDDDVTEPIVMLHEVQPGL